MAKRTNERWNTKRLGILLDKMIEECSDKDDLIYYIGQLLDRHDIYPEWWSRQIDRCKKNSTDKDVEDQESYRECYKKFKRIEQKIEVNLVTAMLTNKVKETTGIFTLKSKHGWKDRQEVSHEHAVKPITINFKVERKDKEEGD